MGGGLGDGRGDEGAQIGSYQPQGHDVRQAAHRHRHGAAVRGVGGAALIGGTTLYVR